MTKTKERGNNDVKRKRKRGAGQSTHLGKSGAVVGILIQRGNAEREMKQVEATKKAVEEGLAKMKALLQKMKDIKEELPTAYWKYDQVKGHRRETLARLLDVYKSGMKAGPLTTALQDLVLTKAQVDTKIQDLEQLIASKETDIPALIANIREQEDFLESTQEYATTEAANKQPRLENDDNYVAEEADEEEDEDIDDDL